MSTINSQQDYFFSYSNNENDTTQNDIFENNSSRKTYINNITKTYEIEPKKPQEKSERNPIKKLIENIPETCLRCKCSIPLIICQDCSPFIYFCSNCDLHIHSMPTKQRHSRIKIEELKRELQIQNNRKNNVSIDFHNQQIIKNQNHQFNRDNYLNDIKRIYDNEKTDLLNKNYSLENELGETKKIMNDKINELNNQYTDFENKKNEEINQMKEKYEFEINNVIKDKDNRINQLLEKNNELVKYNEDLIKKVNLYVDKINMTRKEDMSNKEEINKEIEQLKQEKNNLIKFYENKLQFLGNNFSDDKITIISSYEDQIFKMKNDYSDNLSKLEEILKKRDDDINNIIEQYRKEKEDLTTELQSYIQQFDSSEFAYKDMCTKLNNQKIEIDNLKEKLDKSYKKYIEEMNQRKKIEKENEILQKKNEELTSSVDRLNRITHGRFKSMASKSVYSAKTDY